MTKRYDQFMPAVCPLDLAALEHAIGDARADEWRARLGWVVANHLSAGEVVFACGHGPEHAGPPIGVRQITDPTGRTFIAGDDDTEMVQTINGPLRLERTISSLSVQGTGLPRTLGTLWDPPGLLTVGVDLRNELSDRIVGARARQARAELELVGALAELGRRRQRRRQVTVAKDAGPYELTVRSERGDEPTLARRIIASARRCQLERWMELGGSVTACAGGLTVTERDRF